MPGARRPNTYTQYVSRFVVRSGNPGITPGAIIGGSFELISKLDPLLNGTYTTYKYGFQLSSRDVPFYTILEGTKRYDLYTNTALPNA